MVPATVFAVPFTRSTKPPVVPESCSDTVMCSSKSRENPQNRGPVKGLPTCLLQQASPGGDDCLSSHPREIGRSRQGRRDQGGLRLVSGQTKASLCARGAGTAARMF